MVAEEAIPMLFALLLAVFLFAACAYCVWPRSGGSAGTAGSWSPSKGGSASPGTAGGPAPKPDSLEGVLVTQLAAGEINRWQYLRAMELLAARDDERHPLTAPPENGSAGAEA
jgi:hypothetical protein